MFYYSMYLKDLRVCYNELFTMLIERNVSPFVIRFMLFIIQINPCVYNGKTVYLIFLVLATEYVSVLCCHPCYSLCI